MYLNLLSALLILFSLSQSPHAQHTNSEKKVISLLYQQVVDWNEGDIESFMSGYWNSDELTFIGARGVTNGWEETMASYKRGYPNRQAMGKLRFELIDVKQQSRKVVSVVGKFILDRKDETLDGHFLLLVKKINGKWLVIADHTSSP